MSHEFSRRDFLTGVLVCGAATAAVTYLLPGGRRLSKAELTLVTGKDDTGARRLLIDIWNRANPHAVVNPVFLDGPTADQKSQMAARAKDGAADIVNLDIIDIQDFAGQGLITPIEVPDDTLFIKSVMQAHSVPGASGMYWAVPFNTDVGMLYVRRGERAGPPPGLLGALAEPAVDGVAQFVGQLNPVSSEAYAEAFAVNVLEHALAVDKDILGANGIPSYAPSKWETALAPLREAMAAGRVDAQSDEDATVERFARDPKPRYMRNWPVHYRVLQQKDRDVLEGRITMHSLPIGILGGQSLAVVSSSRHAEVAAEVIRFLTDAAAQKILAAHGFVPTRGAAYDSKVKTFIPHLDEIRGAVERARPRPIHRNYGSFPKVIFDHVEPYLRTGHLDAAKFVADMQVALR